MGLVSSTLPSNPEDSALSGSLVAARFARVASPLGQTGVCPRVLPCGVVNLYVVPPYRGTLSRECPFAAFNSVSATRLGST